jgi:hypothetical protein
MEAAIKSGTLTMTSPSGAAMGVLWLSRAVHHTKERESLGTGNMADITRSSALNRTTGHIKSSINKKQGMIALWVVTFRKQIYFIYLGPKPQDVTATSITPYEENQKFLLSNNIQWC